MKRLIWILAAGVCVMSCQGNENVESGFSGREMVYPLAQGSDYNVHGTVTFRERNDGTSVVAVTLTGTEGTLEHPVHLHAGDISMPGADVAAQLTPVVGASGKSETALVRLSDEMPVTYNELINMNACVKIHLAASGPDRDIILAGGNIGIASTREIALGRSAIGVCKSE
ncbi:MAG: hypothetical protein WKF87_07880 [Chryseolinea sp.]